MLSHEAFNYAAQSISSGENNTIRANVPVGYRPDKQPMLSERSYTKDELVERYQFLAHTQMPINGVYQLVTIIEAMTSDLIRSVVVTFPAKLSSKRQVSLRRILSANTLEQVHLVATDSLINELTYKSPRDFAQDIETIISVNVLECPAFHQYIEMKATRDILIHNQGVVNETYLAKAGSHARAELKRQIPINQAYFMEMYESCLKLCEWLEKELHKVWHSSEFEDRRKANGDA